MRGRKRAAARDCWAAKRAPALSHARTMCDSNRMEGERAHEKSMNESTRGKREPATKSSAYTTAQGELTSAAVHVLPKGLRFRQQCVRKQLIEGASRHVTYDKRRYCYTLLPVALIRLCVQGHGDMSDNGGKRRVV